MKKSKQNRIKDVVIACTEKCNARCRMCNIWKKEVGNELRPADFLHLPKNLRDINISGGEPFLRNDLIEIVTNIKKRCKKAKITFSSNGFATKKIIKDAKEILKIDSGIAIVISIDGVGDNHDKIRGIPGGFKIVMDTIEELKNLRVETKIAFTIADYNYFDLRNVYNLSRELGIEMSLALVHSSENYFNKENKIELKNEIRDSLDWLIKNELSSFNLKRWLRAYFTYGLKIFLLTNTRILPDYSGEKSVFISSNGDIYPSDINNKKIGTLGKEEGFSVDKKKIDNTHPSWMICTTRTAIKRHYLKVITWIIKNKIKYLFFDRSNLFYYVAGFGVMMLNKIRYFIFGYHNPRPIAKKDIEKNVAYSRGVIDNFLKHLKKEYKEDFSFEGKTCLEIGPGSDFGTGLLTMSKGAKSYTGVDRFNLLNFNGSFYDVLGDSLIFSEQLRIKSIISSIKKSISSNEKGEIDLGNFKYVNSAFENVRERIEEKFDIVFSQAVLEHTYDAEKVFEEMCNILKTGGVVIHEIDLATHTSFLREWDALNILRYSEAVYNALKFKGSPNRIRISDYKKIAESAGFKNIKIVPLTELQEKRVEKIKKSFRSKYKDYKASDLKILSAVLIAEK